MTELFNADVARKLSRESDDNHKPFLNKCLSEIKSTAETGKRHHDILVEAIPILRRMNYLNLPVSFKYTFSELQKLGFTVDVIDGTERYIPRSMDQESGDLHKNIYVRVTW